MEPERINTFEINYIGIFEYFNISLSTFRNGLNNLITRISKIDPNGNYESRNLNEGDLVTYGTEFSLDIKLLEDVRSKISISYQKTEDQTEGYEDVVPAYSPNMLGYFKLVYNLNTDITTSASLNYVDEMETYWNPDINTTGGKNIPFGRIGKKSPAYVLMNLNFRYDNFLFEGFYANFKVNNVLGQDIRFPTFTSNKWADKGTLGFGRFFLFTVGWKF